jgi:hypothetical protein
MGGSKPATTTTKTTEHTPKIYKTVIPLQSYKQTAEYNESLRKDLQDAIGNRYQVTGTPFQQGARTRGYEMQEAASYLSSLPTADKYVQATTGSTADPYAAAREAASSRLSAAQTAYGQALQHVNDAPTPLSDRSNPLWAQSTIAEGMPKTEATPTPTPTPAPTNTQNQLQQGSRAWFNQVMKKSAESQRRN